MAGAQRPPGRVRHGAWTVLVAVGAVLGLVVAPAGLGATQAAFSAVTVNPGNALTADRLAAPTNLVAALTCSGGGGSILTRSSQTNTGSTSLSLALPNGWQGDDVLVAQVAASAGATITAPGGWHSVSTQTSGTVTAAVFWKLAATNESSAVFTGSTGADMTGGMLAYGGVDPGAPIVVQATSTGSGTTTTTPSLTTTATNVLALHLLTKAGDQLLAPDGTQLRYRQTSSASTKAVSAASETFAGPGTIVPHSVTSPSAGSWIAQSLVLRRVAGTPSVTLTWNASPSTWAAGYHLSRVEGVTTQPFPDMTRTTTTTTDATVVNDRTYTYQLSTYRDAWTSTAQTTLTTAC